MDDLRLLSPIEQHKREDPTELQESIINDGDDGPEEDHPFHEEDTDIEHCSICLQPYIDRTVIPNCSHEFCFECIMLWTGSF